MLSKFFQLLGHKKKDVSCLVIAMVFVEIWQILPDNIHTLEKSAFKDLQLLVICNVMKSCYQSRDGSNLIGTISYYNSSCISRLT